METVRTIYRGDLRTEATHVQSGNKIVTDAPVDNRGRGEFFSPTDMVAAALASCSLTIMGITAMEKGFSIEGARAATTKIMASDPRRISEIVIEFDFSSLSLTAEERDILEEVSRTCPVCLSLHPDLKKSISFRY
jgi:uncharacterized OsmC-like protein